jgi:SAM-dependent methyltransferase
VEIILIVLGVLFVAFGGVALFGAPYVPSLRRDIARAFDDLYSIGEGDVLVDMGCGDGVVLREAARRGARGIGYELNPFMTLVARLACRKHKDIEIIQANFWHVKVPDATTIVYTFGDSRDIERMATWVESQATRLGKPLYFMSYGFRLNGREPMRVSGAHLLYQITPLQGTKAQV